jgi:hypothetical protein
MKAGDSLAAAAAPHGKQFQNEWVSMGLLDLGVTLKSTITFKHM